MNDASAGEEATKQALVVLREFYSSQAGRERALWKGIQYIEI